MANTEARKHCPTCGQQFDGPFQYCPFDATPLGRRCPSCGKVWEQHYQFCPIDSSPLGVAGAPPVSAAPAPPPAVATPPVVSTPPPPAPAPAQPEPPAPAEAPPARPAAFTFTEQIARPDWRAALRRPGNILFAIGALVVLSVVWYLHWKTSGPSLPTPLVSYQLLPNEGKTKGVPIAIKINHLAIFLIDDPADTAGGAARAKQLVATLEETLRPLQPDSDVRFAVERLEGRAVIQEIKHATDQRRTLATVQDGDMALAGATDPATLAAAWAERLTDAVKVYVFGQPPTFSTSTEFGQALLTMYKSATAGQTKLSKKALDNAFRRLTPGQRRALETPPVATAR